jgi:Spy/CpxP family protein refolding chaperone
MAANPSSRVLGPSPRVVLGLLALAVLGFGAAAVAAPSGWFGHGARHGGHGFFGAGGHGHAFSEEHIADGVRHALRDVDASDAQVEAVTRILHEAASDLERLHPDRDALREAWTGALVAADREALETERGKALAALDEASRRVIAAVGDAVEVLSPKQRAQLAAAHDHR